MDKQYVFIFLAILSVFVLGFTGGAAFVYLAEGTPMETSRINTASGKQSVSSNDITRFEEIEKGSQSLAGIDIPSPSERIFRDKISVFDNEVVIKVENPQWAIFTDTNSMDPIIDDTSKAIEVMPKSTDDVNVGDIVAYRSKYKDGVIAHRVVETGYDSSGWYAKMKGDNNEYVDPGKIRFDQIERVVVAIIY